MRDINDTVVLTTQIPGLPLHAVGKVRDVYRVGEDALLLVATDRISAFDVVLRQGIPDKGRVLNLVSAHWFGELAQIVPNHLLTVDDDAIADRLAFEGVVVTDELRTQLRGRATLCRRTTPLPIEAVVRGYLSGSAWQAYRQATVTNGVVDLWGNALPAGLRESEKLPRPLFTPSTKASEGHDEPMHQSAVADYVGEFAAPIERAALALYQSAADRMAARGILVADTKFEFGTVAGDSGMVLTLIDEVLTPDSSRFWPADGYAPGRPQPSWDKQFVRDYLLSVPDWDKSPPAPDLPPAIIAQTADKYREAYRLITGQPLPPV